MRKSFTNLFYLLLIIGTLLSGEILAQNVHEKILIRGKVTDKQDKSAVIGASVVEYDKDKRIISGVVTDLEGNFALKVSDPSHKIVFTLIGFKTVTVDINNRSIINIQMESDIKELQVVEVVAQKVTDNGMGMAIAERDQTSATARVNAKDLEELQATSIDQALQGRMAGVDIVANTGDPGSGMAIRIRGTSSLNQSSDPLIIVDGMPYDLEVSNFNFATADEQGYAQLLNIAPADIKDITVLKDAAATAVWGSRASNGVLVINTKRGVKGKPTFNYSTKGVITRQPSAIPMLNGDQYSSLIPEEYMNGKNGTPLNTTSIKEFQYDPNDPYWYKNYGNNTDWIGAITQTGYIQDHTLSLNGGGEKASYYTSVGYNGQRGTTIGTDLQRITARVNLDYNVSDRIKFRTDVSYTHVDNDQNYTKTIRSVAYRKMPNMSIYEYDEFGNQTGNYFSPYINVQGQYVYPDKGTYNPVAMANEAKSKEIGDRIRPTFNIKYDILPSQLVASFDIAFDINNSKTTRFIPQIATGLPSTSVRVNQAEESESDNFSVQTKTNLIYSPKIKNDKHKVQVLMSFMTSDSKGVGYFATTSNAASSYFQDPSYPSRTQNSELGINSSAGQSRSLGLLFNAQYSILDRYILNAGIRRDGNSKFDAKHRYGDFPSVSVRWRVSGEKFMESLTFIDDFSLRASYGTSGNASGKDVYGFYSYYETSPWNYMNMTGIIPTKMELKNLKWETVKQSNFGVNLQFLKGKFGVNGDVYNRRIQDLFYENLVISQISGFDKINMNVGVMDNIGWEIAFFSTPIKKKNLNVRFDINISKNFNIMREISPKVGTTAGKINTNGEYKAYLQVNNPFGSFYGFRYKGVYKDAESTIAKDKNGNSIADPNGNPVYMRFNYPTANYIFQPGDAIYEDINHDGNINDRDVVYLGNANPKFQGGFGPSVTYKRFKINMFFNYRYKYDIINLTKMVTTNMSGYDNQSTAVLKRWRKEGDVTDMPRALFGTGYNWLGSDRYVEDGSFIRLKYVTVRYDFAPKMLEKIKVKQLGFYGTVENLYTFTKYTGQDPEVSYRGGAFDIGKDDSRTPPVKSITFGLNVRF